ncbi:MAG: hypothetical protein LBM77_09250, partial [Spirochaetaceae bacterium]|nr:hypothetical protein [Spirochaetaceae bacterium]
QDQTLHDIFTIRPKPASYLHLERPAKLTSLLSNSLYACMGQADPPLQMRLSPHLAALGAG